MYLTLFLPLNCRLRFNSVATTKYTPYSISHHLQPTMEPANVESVSSVLPSTDPLNSGQENDKIESVVESMPRENSIPVHCEENVQTNNTALAQTRTKRSAKRKTRTAVLKKNQSIQKKGKKRKIVKKKDFYRLGTNTTLATIFTKLPLTALIEMAHNKSRLVKL